MPVGSPSFAAVFTNLSNYHSRDRTNNQELEGRFGAVWDR